MGLFILGHSRERMRLLTKRDLMALSGIMINGLEG